LPSRLRLRRASPHSPRDRHDQPHVDEHVPDADRLAEGLGNPDHIAQGEELVVVGGQVVLGAAVFDQVLEQILLIGVHQRLLRHGHPLVDRDDERVEGEPEQEDDEARLLAVDPGEHQQHGERRQERGDGDPVGEALRVRHELEQQPAKREWIPLEYVTAQVLQPPTDQVADGDGDHHGAREEEH